MREPFAILRPLQRSHTRDYVETLEGEVVRLTRLMDALTTPSDEMLLEMRRVHRATLRMADALEAARDQAKRETTAGA